MTIEFETDIYKVYWHSKDKVVLVIDIFEPWTWDVIYDLVERTNSTINEIDHDTYTVVVMSDKVEKFPIDNQLSISIISQLIRLDPAKEELIYFTGNMRFLKILIKVSAKLYNLAQKTSKYRYADDLESALNEIEQHIQDKNQLPLALPKTKQ